MKVQKIIYHSVLEYSSSVCPWHAEECKLPISMAELHLTAIQALIMKERGLNTEKLLYKNMTGS